MGEPRAATSPPPQGREDPPPQSPKNRPWTLRGAGWGRPRNPTVDSWVPGRLSLCSLWQLRAGAGKVPGRYWAGAGKAMQESDFVPPSPERLPGAYRERRPCGPARHGMTVTLTPGNPRGAFPQRVAAGPHGSRQASPPRPRPCQRPPLEPACRSRRGGGPWTVLCPSRHCGLALGWGPTAEGRLSLGPRRQRVCSGGSEGPGVPRQTGISLLPP